MPFQAISFQFKAPVVIMGLWYLSKVSDGSVQGEVLTGNKRVPIRDFTLFPFPVSLSGMSFPGVFFLLVAEMFPGD